MSKKNINFTSIACSALLLLGSATANATNVSVTGGSFVVDYTNSVFLNAYKGYFQGSDVATYAAYNNGTEINAAANLVTLSNTDDHTASFTGSSVTNPSGLRNRLATNLVYDDSATDLTSFVSSIVSGSNTIGTNGSTILNSNTVAGDFTFDMSTLNATAGTIVGVNQIDFVNFNALNLTNITLDSIGSAGFTLTGDVILHNNLVPFVDNSLAGVTVGTFSMAATTSPVPVPAAVWLFGTALTGLFVSSRKKRSLVVTA